jgi:AAA domain
MSMTNTFRKPISKEEIARIIHFYPVVVNSFLEGEQQTRLEIVNQIYKTMGSAEPQQTFFQAPGLRDNCGWYLKIEKGRLDFSLGISVFNDRPAFSGSILKTIISSKGYGSFDEDYDIDTDEDRYEHLNGEEFREEEILQETDNITLFDRTLILDWHEELFEQLMDLRAGECLWVGGSEQTGKTMALEIYSKYLGFEIYKAPPDGSPESLLEVLGNSSYKRHYNKYDRWKYVCEDYFQGYLIIDNAHYLKKSCYSYLKHIADCKRTRIILIGNNSVSSHLKSNDMTLLFQKFEVPKLLLADDVLDVIWSYCAEEVLSNKDILAYGVDELLSHFDCFGKEYADFESDINLAKLIQIINRTLKIGNHAI